MLNTSSNSQSNDIFEVPYPEKITLSEKEKELLRKYYSRGGIIDSGSLTKEEKVSSNNKLHNKDLVDFNSKNDYYELTHQGRQYANELFKV